MLYFFNNFTPSKVTKPLRHNGLLSGKELEKKNPVILELRAPLKNSVKKFFLYTAIILLQFFIVLKNDD